MLEKIFSSGNSWLRQMFTCSNQASSRHRRRETCGCTYLVVSDFTELFRTVELFKTTKHFSFPLVPPAPTCSLLLKEDADQTLGRGDVRRNAKLTDIPNAWKGSGCWCMPKCKQVLYTIRMNPWSRWDVTLQLHTQAKSTVVIAQFYGSDERNY